MNDFNQELEHSEHKKHTPRSPLVQVEKIINTPIEKIFNAWKSEKLIKQWWGPKGFSCPQAELKFEEGGDYLFAMKKDGGEKILWSGGKIIEIIDNQKIVLTDHPSNEKGEEISAEEAGFNDSFAEVGEAYITVELLPLDGKKTRLSLFHEGLPAGIHDECVEGWSSSLDKLKELLESH